MYYWISSILIILASVLFLFLRNKKNRKKSPPGPKGYPFLGNVFDVDFESMHMKFDEWAKEFGDVFCVNIFGRHMVVLNSGTINREAFLQEPNATILADRIKGMVGKDFYFNYHDIAFSPQNEKTISRRKLGYRLMKFYGEGMERIQTKIQKELIDLMAFIDKADDGIINAENTVDRFLFGVLTGLTVDLNFVKITNVLSFCKKGNTLAIKERNHIRHPYEIEIIGRHYDVDSEFVSTLREFDHLLTLMMDPGYDMLFKWFPFVRYIPCKAASEYKRAKAAQKKFFTMLLKETKKHPEEKGIFQDLLKAQQTDRDKNGELWIQDDDINGILTNVVSAAFLTTKGTLMSLLRYLIENQEVQKRLQKEVDTIVGSHEVPIFNQRSKMPYTEAVVMETLRIISHVSLSVPHASSRHTSLHGFDIPTDSVVISNLWSVHHDEKVYPCPFKFDPGRFLDHDGQILSYDSDQVRNLLPFGIGKRSCIGEVFARSRIFLFLSTIMQNYTLHQDVKNPLPPFDPRTIRPGIVRIPQEYIFKAVKRN